MSEVSKEYGRALYELALEEGCEGEYLAELREIDQILLQNPDYVRLLSVPNIAADERTQMVEDCFGGRCKEYTVSFLKIMTERGYSSQIRASIGEFEELYREAHGIVRALCVSAVPLDENQRAALIEKLEAHTKKKVELSERTDALLIGGIRVEVDGKLFEGSVRSRLDKMRSDISKTIL